MKRWLLLLWLLVPLPILVWHYGPGQRWLALDQARSLITKAQREESKSNFAAAEALYREAASKIRNSDAELKGRLDVAMARTRYRQGGVIEAIDLLAAVIDDPRFHRQPVDFQREARELAARVQYHAAWVMRLEGAQRDLWMEAAETARQNFRMLSEESLVARDVPYSSVQQTNLETAVRLQRLSLTELMGRPLPEEAQMLSGQGLSEQMARRRGQRGQNPGIGNNDEGEPAAGAGTARFPGGPGS